jgi:hypothetical protein
MKEHPAPQCNGVRPNTLKCCYMKTAHLKRSIWNMPDAQRYRYTNLLSRQTLLQLV